MKSGFDFTKTSFAEAIPELACGKRRLLEIGSVFVGQFTENQAIRPDPETT
jgi:hypothetical protein